MEKNPSKEEPATAPVATMTVVQSALSKFLDELGKTEGFSEIAPKLRKVILDDGVFAEPPIRIALFSDLP